MDCTGKPGTDCRSMLLYTVFTRLNTAAFITFELAEGGSAYSRAAFIRGRRLLFQRGVTVLILLVWRAGSIRKGITRDVYISLDVALWGGVYSRAALNRVNTVYIYIHRVIHGLPKSMLCTQRNNYGIIQLIQHSMIYIIIN